MVWLVGTSEGDEHDLIVRDTNKTRCEQTTLLSPCAHERKADQQPAILLACRARDQTCTTQKPRL